MPTWLQLSGTYSLLFSTCRTLPSHMFLYQMPWCAKYSLVVEFLNNMFCWLFAFAVCSSTFAVYSSAACLRDPIVFHSIHWGHHYLEVVSHMILLGKGRNLVIGVFAGTGHQSFRMCLAAYRVCKRHD